MGEAKSVNVSLLHFSAQLQEINSKNYSKTFGNLIFIYRLQVVHSTDVKMHICAYC